MLTSLALVFLLGLAAAALCSRIGLPRIIGMLLSGILIGPYVLNWLDDSILSISSELRQMALIIILIKAGLSLDLSDLKKVGRPAVMMACVPASCEILAFFLLAPHILGINRIEAAVMGAVLGAVSPAVVVPRMVQLMEEKRGTGQGIPQMILAGASCDDIYVIVLFSTFVGMAQGGSANMMDFVNIPVSIVLGVALGAAVGLLLHLFLETAYRHGCYVRNSTKVILILGLSFLLMAVETWLKGIVSVSGLLAVMSMACVLKIKSPEKVTKRLSAKFGKLWIAAEAILFVLVGAAVDIRCAVQAGAARCAHDRTGARVPRGRREHLYARYRAEPKGAPVLRHRLSAEGNRAGGHRLGAAVDGLAVRTAGAFGGGARHPDYRAARRHWHRPYRRTPSRAGEPVRYCRMRICWVRL